MYYCHSFATATHVLPVHVPALQAGWVRSSTMAASRTVKSVSGESSNYDEVRAATSRKAGLFGLVTCDGE